MHAAAPPVDDLPAGQTEHVEGEVRVDPGRHVVQLVLPSEWVTCPAEQGRQTVAPASGWYLPKPHAVQPPAGPPSAAWPAGHGTHELCSTTSPASHARQLWFPPEGR